MASFTVRIVMHAATWEDYSLLYEQLAAYGFTDEITCDSGRQFKLPPGEYNFIGNVTAQQVHDCALGVADAIAPSEVLVTEVTSRVWTLRPVNRWAALLRG